MSFLQPFMLIALPVIGLPILIHLINQRRYQTRQWGAMMFLLAANRINRGFARIRQWLILAMRTLAIAALIFAIARPLASGVLGVSGVKADTTIVLMDRSPSMQQVGVGGLTKLETGRQQLYRTLETLGSDHWVAIDAATHEVQSFDSLDDLMNASAMQPATATSDLVAMLTSALEYLKENKPGSTEIWICSDLKEADWNAQSGTWNLIREGFQRLPQTVQFHLLAYPEVASSNLAVRVTEARIETSADNGPAESSLVLSMQVNRTSTEPEPSDAQEIPLQIEIDGKRSMLTTSLSGQSAEIHEHRIALTSEQKSGWGRVSLPADASNGDNEFYFVYSEPPTPRIVVISEDREATLALEIAAAVSADGTATSLVEVLTATQLSSLVLDDTSLLLWQTELPDPDLSRAIEKYIDQGGQVVFFPPSSMFDQSGEASTNRFLGVAWDEWFRSDTAVQVDSWRGDQDLFAATSSGAGLPVGELELQGYAKLIDDGEMSHLATLTTGDPLLTRVPTDKGGVYFMTASPEPGRSSLASDGVVLFVAMRRAIERGQNAMANTAQQIAGEVRETTSNWRKIAGAEDALSTEFGYHAGVYQTGQQWAAVNRSPQEDLAVQLMDAQLSSLFAGLQFTKVNDSAGNLSGIFREVWRFFLVSMIVALLIEASLCLPRVPHTAKVTTA